MRSRRRIPGWFWTWARWRLGRGEFRTHGPANPSVRPRLHPVPGWAWKEYRRRFLRPSPSPPLPHKLTWKGLFVAHGLRGDGPFDPSRLCALAQGAGVGWIALQASEPGHTALRAACDAHGILYGMWDAVEPDAERVAWLARQRSARFWIAQSEGPGQCPEPEALRAALTELPLAVVTNLWFDPRVGARFVAQGFACIPEAYVPENPQATPAAMVFEAVRRGWDERDVFPVVGVYHGVRLADYLPLRHPFSVWLPEYMSGEDWTALGSA